MSEIKIERLADICEIVVGRTPSRNDPSFWGHGHPWLSIADMNQGLLITKTKEEITDLGAAKGKLVPAGTVLLSFKLSIGKVSIAGMPLYTNEAIAALVIKNPKKIDSRYLMWTLKSMDLATDSNRAAMGATLNKAKLQEIRIPIPPLDEQIRKVQIEDIQFAIVQKRERQQELFIEFERAIFNQKYAKAMKVVKLGDIVEIRSGLVDPTLPEYQDLPHIGPDSIVGGRDEIRGWRTAAEDGVKSGKFLFKKGDILYSKIRPNLNKVAIAQFDGLCSADMYPLIVNNNLVDSKYLQMTLSSESFIAYANSLSNRANIPKLNKNQLLSFELKI